MYVIKLLEILNKNKMGRIYQSTFYYGDDLRKWHIYEDYTRANAAKKSWRRNSAFFDS